jgi:HK97 family phage portal protein
MGILARVGSAVARTFAPFAPGGWGFTPPSDWPQSWFQQGYRLPYSDGNATVEACVGAISQTIASLPIYHWKELPTGEQVKIKTSAASRVLRKPNDYQTRADFIMNLLRNELLTGNGYAVVERNLRNEITSLNPCPPRTGIPYVAEDNSVFYTFNEGPMIPEPPIEDFWPSNYVLHLRMNTPRHPLIGESPIVAAAMSVSAGNAVVAHMSSFFNNMSRPSGYLSSPGKLAPDVAERLRTDWNEAYGKGGSGKVAALQGGLEWKALSISSVDSQLIESYKMTVADIARVYRVPLAIVGDMTGSTYSSTETLVNHWLSTGLGYILEHLELAFDKLFDLPADEFIAFDVDQLLRTDFKTRIEGLVRGVQGGIFAPNEARVREGLPPVAFGDEPRVQAQVVPLSFASAAPTAPSAPSAPGASETPPVDPNADLGAPPPDPGADPNAGKSYEELLSEFDMLIRSPLDV